MTEGQNDGMMNAKPKSNISKWGFITIYVSVLIMIIKYESRTGNPFLHVSTFEFLQGSATVLSYDTHS